MSEHVYVRYIGQDKAVIDVYKGKVFKMGRIQFNLLKSKGFAEVTEQEFKNAYSLNKTVIPPLELENFTPVETKKEEVKTDAEKLAQSVNGEKSTTKKTRKSRKEKQQ